MILLVTPPLTQLNTPYPATTQLKAFLEAHNIPVCQADFGIELVDRVFTPDFIRRAFPKGHPDVERYASTVKPVVGFLRGDDPSLAQRIITRCFLPEGKHFANAEDLEWAFGVAGTEDKARYLATLYLEDISDIFREFVDPNFDMVRYAEKLCSFAPTFDSIGEALQKPLTLIEVELMELLDARIRLSRPDVVGFTVPFPGCLLPALRCCQYIKRKFPNIKLCMGGGFPNTEWRSMRETALFDYVDYVTLDDGELPMLRLIEHLNGSLPKENLLRTYFRKDDKVVYVNNVTCDLPVQVLSDELPAPDFEGLPLHLYLSTADMTNPMHRMWSCGRWNKMMMAHGCYWAKCAFCDTTLDYIGRYDAPTYGRVVDRMERVMDQTGCCGFHFVDEALPPHLLRMVCEEIVRRGLVVSFWGNIRFDKSYNSDFCHLLSEAGCIAVSGGLEVASDRLLKLMDKGVTVQQAIQAARHLHQAGIMVHFYLMYGFPTETLNETVGALENVRKMFAEGIVQSAFWHRYAMTVHSPSGRNPKHFGAIRMEEGICNPFCNNEIPFEYDFGYDLEAVGAALRMATYNYMNGYGLDMPAKKWFRNCQ